jgi:DNA modification methylase
MGGHYLADAMVWLPHLGKIYTHGLKHEYEQWCKKNKRDPLSHIPTGNNIGDGVYAPGTAGPGRDPLAHIPTNPEGMYAVDGTGVQYNSNKYKAVGNNHPTVKPVALMRYLIKLVTAQGSHIIDPFSGSGTTGMACRELARTFTGIDLDPHYCEIARRRIAATQEDKSETLFE